MSLRIGFIFDTPDYKGGFYYLVTLVEAILQSSSNEVIVFVGSKDCKDKLTNHIVSNRLQIVVNQIFCCHEPINLVFKFFRLLGIPFFFEYFARKYSINIFSHSEAPFSWFYRYQTFNWIPDLQFIDLPHNFSPLMRIRYWQRFLSFIVFSDKVVFSSYHSRARCLELYPYLRAFIQRKSFILQFCSSKLPHHDSQDFISSFFSNTALDPSQPFMFLPNQFWLHKNHVIFLKAFQKILYLNPCMQLVLTGINQDFRNPQYSHDLASNLLDSKFGPNIYYFPEVSRPLFSYFLNNCCALVNPSLYEGWSTTIEEAISVRKHLIISDLPVNFEQTHNYSAVHYFHPTSLNSIISSLSVFLTAVDIHKPNNHDEEFHHSRFKAYLNSVSKLYA